MLNLVTQNQQALVGTAQLAVKLVGADPLGDPAHNDGELGGTAVRALQARAGKQVEHMAAMLTLKVQHRLAFAVVNVEPVASAATRTDPALRPKNRLEPSITDSIIEHISEREQDRHETTSSAGTGTNPIRTWAG